MSESRAAAECRTKLEVVHYFAVTLILLIVFVTGFVVGILVSPGDVYIRHPEDVPFPVKKPVVSARSEPPDTRSGNTQ